MKGDVAATMQAPDREHLPTSPRAAINGRTKVQLQNILVATDFSAASNAALSHAMSIARLYDSHLYIAHVVRSDVYEWVPPGALPSVAQQIRQTAEQNMADLLISGRLRGIPHQVLLEEGEFWSTLARMIEKHEIDLVVAGTHGRTGVRKLLLGSVAEEIFRLASLPVLTVGPKVPGEVPEVSKLREILYATDFTPTSQRGAAYAFSLAQEHQARLTVLHVVQEELPATSENRRRLEEVLFRRFRELEPAEAELWCESDFVVEFGAPADRILHAATEREADLIVLGVRRSASFPGHLPPATAYKVVCQAHCPVLTVRG